MDKRTAEKARQLLGTMERLEEIQQAMEKCKSRWWSFLTPDAFNEAVERAIEKTKAKLDKL